MKIIEAVAKIEEVRGWNYCGKEIKKGKTYYMFIDADYIPHYIYCKDVVEYAELYC